MGVSRIAIWETAMLHEKGRIVLSLPCREWTELALSRSGVNVAALTPEIAMASCRLPGVLHGDPADRFLIATARNLGMTLATRDERILDYGQQGHVAVLAI